MDTLTHSLISCAASDAFLRSRLGRLATPFALAAGALPDADVVMYLVSPESAWTLHRGITHSLLPIVLVAPALALAGHQLSGRKGRFRDWAALALAALLGHTFFDLLTSWGTMPFLPFSDARASWDIVPILDVFLTSAAGLSFVLNRFLRWEKVDSFQNPMMYPVVHRHPERRRAGDIIGKVALALIALYLAVGVQQNFQTARIARAELAAAGVRAAEVRAMPIMFTYIASSVAARGADGAIYTGLFSGYAPRPIAFARHSPAAGPAVAAALDSPAGRRFRWFTQGFFAAREEAAAVGGVGAAAASGARRIVLGDLRFVDLTDPARARTEMVFDVGPDGELASAGARRHGGRTDLLRELEILWRLTWRGGLDMPGQENP